MNIKNILCSVLLWMLLNNAMPATAANGAKPAPSLWQQTKTRVTTAVTGISRDVKAFQKKAEDRALLTAAQHPGKVRDYCLRRFALNNPAAARTFIEKHSTTLPAFVQALMPDVNQLPQPFIALLEKNPQAAQPLMPLVAKKTGLSEKWCHENPHRAVFFLNPVDRIVGSLINDRFAIDAIAQENRNALQPVAEYIAVHDTTANISRELLKHQPEAFAARATEYFNNAGTEPGYTKPIRKYPWWSFKTFKTKPTDLLAHLFDHSPTALETVITTAQSATSPLNGSQQLIVAHAIGKAKPWADKGKLTPKSIEQMAEFAKNIFADSLKTDNLHVPRGESLEARDARSAQWTVMIGLPSFLDAYPPLAQQLTTLIVAHTDNPLIIYRVESSAFHAIMTAIMKHDPTAHAQFKKAARNNNWYRATKKFLTMTADD